MATIASVISNISLNVLSSFIYDKGNTFFSPLMKEQIEKKICTWSEKFFSTHSEMVFETSQFYNYITYQT